MAVWTPGSGCSHNPEYSRFHGNAINWSTVRERRRQRGTQQPKSEAHDKKQGSSPVEAVLCEIGGHDLHVANTRHRRKKFFIWCTCVSLSILSVYDHKFTMDRINMLPFIQKDMVNFWRISQCLIQDLSYLQEYVCYRNGFVWSKWIVWYDLCYRSDDTCYIQLITCERNQRLRRIAHLANDPILKTLRNGCVSISDRFILYLFCTRL